MILACKECFFIDGNGALWLQLPLATFGKIGLRHLKGMGLQHLLGLGLFIPKATETLSLSTRPIFKALIQIESKLQQSATHPQPSRSISDRDTIEDAGSG